MTCPQCGTALDAAARFCGACGKKLSPEAAQRVEGRGPATTPARPAMAPPRVMIAPASGSSPPGNGQPAPAAARLANASASTEPAPPVAPAGTPPHKPVAHGSGPSGAAATLASKPAVPPLGKMGPGGAPGKDPFIGQTLNGRYLIETKLGQGGFGAVYKGKQVIVGREVAIKVLHPEMARDQNLLQRFKREGTVACNLRDAHTVTTYDFDQTPDGVLYIAMELLAGKSLHDIFYDEAPLSWRRVLRVLEQMCSSLGEAHRQGIVHRDIKPENIYLEERPGNPDYVKVLDFGIAKIIRGDIGGSGAAAPQLTATGQTLGTLEYMSPEQLMGKQLDGRSDIYAMGVLAFELLTGHLPFPEAQGPAELIGAQLKKVPPAPSAANPSGDIPQGVDAIILRMLEKDRGKRYQDVDELAGDIAPALSSNGRATGPANVLTSSGVTPPPVTLDARTPPPMMVPAAVVAAAAASPVLATASGAPRPYVLAPTTSESTTAGGQSKVILWALIALIVVAGALAGVYFGVIKRNQARSATPPPAAERR